MLLAYLKTVPLWLWILIAGLLSAGGLGYWLWRELRSRMYQAEEARLRARKAELQLQRQKSSGRVEALAQAIEELEKERAEVGAAGETAVRAVEALDDAEISQKLIQDARNRKPKR